MTEKRFTGHDVFNGVNEYFQFYNNNKRISNEKILDLLNNLHEENQSLKFQLKECSENKLFSRRELERENNELKQFQKKVFQVIDEEMEQYKNLEPRERSINDAVFILNNLKKELEE